MAKTASVKLAKLGQGRSGSGLSRLARDRRGVAALEFALIMPFLVLLLAGIIQFGMIFFMQNQMSDVARDVARRVAVGELTDVQGVAAAQNGLIDYGINHTIVVTVPDGSDPADTDVTVTISAPMSEVSLIDILGIFDSSSLQTVVTMRQE